MTKNGFLGKRALYAKAKELVDGLPSCADLIYCKDGKTERLKSVCGGSVVSSAFGGRWIRVNTAYLNGGDEDLCRREDIFTFNDNGAVDYHSSSDYGYC